MLLRARALISGRIDGTVLTQDETLLVAGRPEVHTLVWPNGADFDPATLHDWPQYLPELMARAREWELTPA